MVTIARSEQFVCTELDGKVSAADALMHKRDIFSVLVRVKITP